MIVKPAGICVNASSVCQLKCPECTSAVYVRRMKEKGVERYLRAADFESLLGENTWVRTVNFVSLGELFLNPDLVEMLRCAFERNVEVLIDAVNLNDAGDEALEALVRYKVRSLLVSIDGASDDVYRTYRVGGDLSRVLENVRKINDYKREYDSPFPFLTWKFIIFGFNEHEISAARELAGRLDMQFMPDIGTCGAGSELYPEDPARMKYRALDSVFSPIRDRELVRGLLGYASVEEFQKLYGSHNRQGACPFLFVAPFVNHDGTMLGCCYTDPENAFGGNAFDEGLLDCVNSEKMRRARRMLVGGARAGGDVPCSSCWVYEDMVNGGGRLEAERWTWREPFMESKVKDLARFQGRCLALERHVKGLEARLELLESDLAARDDALLHTEAHAAQLEQAVSSRPTARIKARVKRLFGNR